MSERRYPTPRQELRSHYTWERLLLYLALLVIAALATFAYRSTLDISETPDSDPAVPHHVTQDSLGVSYTYDGKLEVRWYVFTDPETGVEYLFNDLGGCTPRVEADDAEW